MRNFLLLMAVISINASGQNCYKESTDKNIDSEFNSLWLNMTFQGTIGDSNQRIEVRFLTITPEKKSPGTFKATGKSRVNDNICEFSGSIKVKKIMILIEKNRDCEGPDYSDGIISGTYELKENPKQKYSGVFKGDFKTECDKSQDGFKPRAWHYSDEGTNVFTGTWNEHNKKTSKYCSWGRHVPPSKNNDLFKHYDNEAYLFNIKYMDKGWRSYVISNLKSWICLPVDFDGDKPKFEVDFIDTYKDEEIEKYKEIEGIEWWK